MTVAADKTKEIYTGNDVTTVFPYPFKIFQPTDMLVILTDTTVIPDTETTLTEGVDYTVSGVGDESGGNVTYPVSGDPLATGEKLTVWRVPAILQGTDFQNQGGFFAQTHEDALDLLTMVCQYISEFVQRAFALSVSDESGASLIVPGPEASKVLGWNSVADALINLDTGSVTLALPASDSIIADMINAAGTQATLTKLLSGNTAICQKGADVASAAVLPVLSDGNYVDVTGVAAITSINSVGIGTVMMLQFDGILTLTHHATDLILPGGANITTAAGDHTIMAEYAAGDWRCVSYVRAISLPIYSDGGIELKVKIIDIGDWDMTATNFVNVTHGLTLSKIRDVSAVIRNNANTQYHPMDYDELFTGRAGYIGITDITVVELQRKAAGFFDDAQFNATSYNRGWVTITYIA